MGFKLERTVYPLAFDDPEYEGLTIRVRARSMQEVLDGVALNWLPDDPVEERSRKQAAILDSFVAHIVDWNLEDGDGEPVPVTVEGLRGACEPEQLGYIVGVWLAGRQRIAAPLEQPSPASSLSEIPMTVLASTPEPVSSSAC